MSYGKFQVSNELENIIKEDLIFGISICKLSFFNHEFIISNKRKEGVFNFWIL